MFAKLSPFQVTQVTGGRSSIPSYHKLANVTTRGIDTVSTVGGSRLLLVVQEWCLVKLGGYKKGFFCQVYRELQEDGGPANGYHAAVRDRRDSGEILCLVQEVPHLF